MHADLGTDAVVKHYKFGSEMDMLYFGEDVEFEVLRSKTYQFKSMFFRYCVLNDGFIIYHRF